MSWSQGAIVGFDLETTGVDTETDVPVSYAFVRYEQGWNMGSLGGLVNPGREIPEPAIAVHGITTERAIAEGEDLSDAIRRIRGFLVEGSERSPRIPVVGMNVSYDLKMIDACSRRLDGISLTEAGFAGPVLDVLVIDRHYDKYRKGGRKLIDLCDHYGVDAGNLHDANADVAATVSVLLAQVARYEELGSMGLDELHVAQQKWHRDWAENFSGYLVSKGKEPLGDSVMDWPLVGSGVRQRQMRI
jgi:DNA polymerase-3 subunit epsilon